MTLQSGLSITLTRVIKAFLAILIRWAPKVNYCVLRGYPAYEDNLLAIYQELLKRGFDKIIWVTDNPGGKKPFHAHSSTVFVARGSWRDYLYCFVAKYLFITHGHFIERIPANQISVNLWHGIPYKVIGTLDGKAGREDTFLVATSELTRQIFAKSFGVATTRVVVTGQARTDRLFVPDALDIRQRILPIGAAATKIFLWLPTFRTTDAVGGRQDGQDLGNIFNCSDFSVDEFNRYLCNHNAVCFVKPHPMARRQSGVPASNLIYIDEEWLNQRHLTLYQLTGVSDCLISDISSIIVDYMLLDRPVVLLFEDIDDYEQNRGFSFNPIADWLPSPVNRDYAGFIHEVDAVCEGFDLHRSKRNALKNQFFTYQDNQSSARILDLVMGKDTTA